MFQGPGSLNSPATPRSVSLEMYSSTSPRIGVFLAGSRLPDLSVPLWKNLKVLLQSIEFIVSSMTAVSGIHDFMKTLVINPWVSRMDRV